MNYPKADETTKQQARNFIKENPMAILSTVSQDGQPWGSAIYCVADKDFNFYFVTRSQTQKFKDIDSNPNVALTLANPDSQCTVQVAGTVSKVPSKDIIDVVFKQLADVKPHGDADWLPPIIKVHQGDWMILKITPGYAQFADYKVRKTDPQDTYIKSLI